LSSIVTRTTLPSCGVGQSFGSRRITCAPRATAKQLGDQRLDLIALEIPRHHQRTVVGEIEVGEEVLDVVDVGRFQILVRPVHILVVRVPDRVHVACHKLVCFAIWRVLDLLADLVAHDIALLVEFLGRHGAAKVLHAIRIQPEQRRQ
jgi:hypothetical protein